MEQQFSITVSKFTKNTENKLRRTVRWLCLEISRRVIFKTPVDTGRARGSWVPALEVLPKPEGESAADKAGGVTLGAVSQVVAEYKLGDTFYLVSNLPYIAVLEYGRYPNPPAGGGGKTVGGFSRKAPQGMVRVTLAEFPGIVEQAVSKAVEG